MFGHNEKWTQLIICVWETFFFPIDLLVSPYLFLVAAKEAPIVTPITEYVRQ